ncbi:DNA cytosine methyltransferase [Stenotrophomonas sp.]|uniref:DNA cytosine methyltransferase n=1 Tax=Stenotrophomonas sp. TaxID=69392 RepID=UPI0031B6E302
MSLFSGMEAAHLAWAPLGWECVGVAEIDPAPCALLAHRLPHVPNLGSVTDITDEQIAALGRIDVVIGGSPCQDLSVAGNRAGLAGARSGLFHEQLRIFNAARTFCGARWLVWENVPGAFSSNRGRDFAVVAGALAGCELDVPRDGWGNEGVALGPNGLVEWSVLDAQWFGVAQRRRRVFAVLDTGDWAGRPPVLLEPDSLRGDSAPRREAGEAVTGTLSARTEGGGGLGTDFDCAGGLVPEVAPTLLAQGNRTGGDRPPGTSVDTCESLIPEVAHTLRADGFDASEDGTGRGTPLVPVAFDCKSSGQAGFGVGEIASTMRSMGHANCHQNGGGHLAVQQGMQVRRLTPRECERLQGATDDWTLVPNAKGKPMADGPRYKMLGNSFAVPVIRWIGWRIQIAHTWLQRAAA